MLCVSVSRSVNWSLEIFLVLESQMIQIQHGDMLPHKKTGNTDNGDGHSWGGVVQVVGKRRTAEGWSECRWRSCCKLFRGWEDRFLFRGWENRWWPEVESSRTSLASRTHFEVLGLGLEASSPWPSPWPRSLRSSKIALSSARGQHYFLYRWNFVRKRQKPRGEFANTFFVFRNWSIGLAKRAFPQLKIHQWQKCDKKAYCFFSFSFFLAFFAYTRSEQQYWRPGAQGPPKLIFASQFKHKPGRNG